MLPYYEVKRIILDFESAIWGACHEVLPGIEVKGCVFHFTQAIYCKVVDLGFKVAYQTSGPLQAYIHKLMQLPFLQDLHFVPAFEQFAKDATADLVNYMSTQCITSSDQLAV